MLKIRPFTLTIILVVLAVSLLGKGQAPAGAFSQAVPLNPIPELVSQIGGAAYAVTFESYTEGAGHFYVGFGQHLYVYHIDTDTPIVDLLGVSDLLPDFIQGISMVGNYAYVTLGESGLAVVNCTLKDSPVMIGHYDTPGFARGLYMTASTAYVADGPSGVQVLNITNPAAITYINSIDTPGNARDVLPVTDDILGQFFYVADGLSGLRVLDLKNLSIPVEVGHLDTNGFAESLDFQKNFIHLADGSTGWKKIQITNPQTPGLSTSLDTPGYARDVMFYGGEIYVSDGLFGLEVIAFDSETGDPEMIGSIDTPGEAYGMTWAEGLVLIANDYALRVINAASPSSPVEVISASQESPAFASKVTPVGNVVYVADELQGLRIFNAANPAAPSLTGTFDTPGTTHDVAVAGTTAYIADVDQGLRLVDITDPTSPVNAGSVSAADARAVAVDGEYAYVANGANGLMGVHFIGDPTPPEIGEFFVTGGYIKNVAVAGDYVYLADENYGLIIVDRFPLSAMTEVGHIETTKPHAVVVRGSYAYMADGPGGLVIINISNPASPVLVGTYTITTARSVVDIALWGNLVYLAEKEYGLLVINVANPAAPFFVAQVDTLGVVSGVAVDENAVYAADYNGGLLIFSPPPTIEYHISLPLVLK